MKSQLWCPSLNDHIEFNRTGFRHLLHKHGAPRPKANQIRRIALLIFVKDIIQNPDVKIHYQKKNSVYKIKQHGQKISHSHEIEFWKLGHQQENRWIDIIIRRVNNGKRHFYSIYDHD